MTIYDLACKRCGYDEWTKRYEILGWLIMKCDNCKYQELHSVPNQHALHRVNAGLD